MGFGGGPTPGGGERGGPTYLVLDVGVDSLQHPLAAVLVGQVGVYLWEKRGDTWEDTWGRSAGPLPDPAAGGQPCSALGAKSGAPGSPSPHTIYLAPLPHQLEHLPVALGAIPPPACPLPGRPPFVLKLSPHPLLGCDACPSHSQPRWVHPPLLGDTSSRKPSLSPSPTPVQDHCPGWHPRVPPG